MHVKSEHLGSTLQNVFSQKVFRLEIHFETLQIETAMLCGILIDRERALERHLATNISNRFTWPW